MATYSSILAYRIPWTEEPGGLLSIGSHRVGHDWSNLACMQALEKEMATHSSVLAWGIPGMEQPGWLPSMGSHRVGHDWSDATVAVAAYRYGIIIILKNDWILQLNFGIMLLKPYHKGWGQGKDQLINVYQVLILKSAYILHFLFFSFVHSWKFRFFHIWLLWTIGV